MKRACVITAALLISGMAQAADIKVLSTQATEEAYKELVAQFEKTSGHKVSTIFTGTLDVQNRMVDFGVDAYWLSNEPWVVPEPFTPEAGEMYGKEDLDYWIDTIAHIAEEARTEPHRVKSAPYNQAIAQLRPDWLEDPARWAMTWRAYMKKHRVTTG